MSYACGRPVRATRSIFGLLRPADRPVVSASLRDFMVFSFAAPRNVAFLGRCPCWTAESSSAMPTPIVLRLFPLYPLPSVGAVASRLLLSTEHRSGLSAPCCSASATSPAVASALVHISRQAFLVSSRRRCS